MRSFVSHCYVTIACYFVLSLFSVGSWVRAKVDIYQERSRRKGRLRRGKEEQDKKSKPYEAEMLCMLSLIDRQCRKVKKAKNSAAVSPLSASSQTTVMSTEMIDEHEFLGKILSNVGFVTRERRLLKKEFRSSVFVLILDVEC